MDVMHFEQHARQDPQLCAFLQEAAVDAAQQLSITKPQRFATVTGVDLLFGLVAYTLYRLAKDALDHRRALNETYIAKYKSPLKGGRKSGTVVADLP